jgi:DNA-binding LacI/PurR family transcriptional regulator
MLYGIERAARPDYSVAIASLQAFDRRSLLDAVERLLHQGVEGIIVIAPVMTAVAALGALAPDIPLVAAGCLADVALSSVAIDNRAGGAMATRHLLELGHETVYHVAGPKTWLDAQQRIAGWRAALAAASAPEPELLRGDWSARSGYQAGHQLAASSDVTAVLCGNDSMALGVLRALAERGRRVPDDVSVVGFDDIAEAPYFLPPLTTVRQDFGELGRRAVRLLMDQIAAGPSDEAPLPIPPDLVVRASTAPRTGT